MWFILGIVLNCIMWFVHLHTYIVYKTPSSTKTCKYEAPIIVLLLLSVSLFVPILGLGVFVIGTFAWFERAFEHRGLTYNDWVTFECGWISRFISWIWSKKV